VVPNYFRFVKRATVEESGITYPSSLLRRYTFDGTDTHLQLINSYGQIGATPSDDGDWYYATMSGSNSSYIQLERNGATRESEKISALIHAGIETKNADETWPSSLDTNYKVSFDFASIHKHSNKISASLGDITASFTGCESHQITPELKASNGIDYVRFVGNNYFLCFENEEHLQHTGSATYSFWIYPEDRAANTSGVWGTVANTAINGGQAQGDYQFRHTGSSSTDYILETYGANGTVTTASLLSIPQDEWSHIVLTVNREHDDEVAVRAFKNGTFQNTGPIAPHGELGSNMMNGRFRMGDADMDGGNAFWEGGLAKFKVWDRAITDSEAANLWTYESGSYPNNNSPNRSFTIGGWFQRNCNEHAFKPVVGVNTPAGANAAYPILSRQHGRLAFGTNHTWGGSEKTVDEGDIGSVMSYGEWYHLMYTYDHNTTTQKLYINGTSSVTPDTSRTITISADDTWLLGSEFDNASISDLQQVAAHDFGIYGAALTQTEIRNLFDQYTQPADNPTMNPVSSSVGAASSHLVKQYTFDSTTEASILTFDGGTQFANHTDGSTTWKCVESDGTTDSGVRLFGSGQTEYDSPINTAIQNATGSAPATGAISIAMWVCPGTSGNQWRPWMHLGPSDGGNRAWVSTDTKARNIVSATPNKGPSQAQWKWMHICHTIEEGRTLNSGGTGNAVNRVYVNGVELDARAFANWYSGGSATFANLGSTVAGYLFSDLDGSVPSGHSNEFKGRMHDLRIYNKRLTPSEVKSIYDEKASEKPDDVTF
tara:strand:- start:165805 stop:168120 length:2316 start_codon:yes stop_codon:yes gene_type:complete